MNNRILVPHLLFEAVLADLVPELGLDGVHEGLCHHECVPRVHWVTLLHYLLQTGLNYDVDTAKKLLQWPSFWVILREGSYYSILPSYFRWRQLDIVRQTFSVPKRKAVIAATVRQHQCQNWGTLPPPPLYGGDHCYWPGPRAPSPHSISLTGGSMGMGQLSRLTPGTAVLLRPTQRCRAKRWAASLHSARTPRGKVESVNVHSDLFANLSLIPIWDSAISS